MPALRLGSGQAPAGIQGWGLGMCSNLSSFTRVAASVQGDRRPQGETAFETSISQRKSKTSLGQVTKSLGKSGQSAVEQVERSEVKTSQDKSKSVRSLKVRSPQSRGVAIDSLLR
jgi:hypothetical protein